MKLVRLIYFSEIQIDTTSRPLVAQLNDILDVAERRNKSLDITGCLLFDDRWFVQTLEGNADDVWDIYRSIARDKRHTNVTLVDVRPATERRFGGWWMRCVRRNPDARDTNKPYLLSDDFSPAQMSDDVLLQLMTDHRHSVHERRRHC